MLRAGKNIYSDSADEAREVAEAAWGGEKNVVRHAPHGSDPRNYKPHFQPRDRGLHGKGHAFFPAVSRTWLTNRRNSLRRPRQLHP